MRYREHLAGERRCASCRQCKPRQDMLRFYRQEEGWHLDTRHLALLHKQQSNGAGAPIPLPPQPKGRGMWLCRTVACQHPKALGRSFRRAASQVEAQLAALAVPLRYVSNEARIEGALSQG